MTTVIAWRKPCGCAVCGRPTRSKYGICNRSSLCRTKQKQMVRRRTSARRVPAVSVEEIISKAKGTELGIRAIGEELGVSHHTIRRGLEIAQLERRWIVPPEPEGIHEKARLIRAAMLSFPTKTAKDLCNELNINYNTYCCMYAQQIGARRVWVDRVAA